MSAALRRKAILAVACQYVQKYQKKCADAAEFVRATVAKTLDAQGIKCATSARAKDETSLARKLMKKRRLFSLEELIPHVGTARDANTNRVKDLAGARVSLYFPSDWTRVEAQIFTLFKNVTVKVHPETIRTRQARRRFEGYAARHYCLDARHRLRVELQVASALTHAWMEVEHDLEYKPGRKRLDADELATLDGLNGITTAGEALLDGLKVRLLGRGVLKAPRSDRPQTAQLALKSSTSEFIAIGQNLFGLLVGEGPDGAPPFPLIERLTMQSGLTATIIVANPRDKEQMRELAYGFPSFTVDLKRSIKALKILQAHGLKADVGTRLRVGTSRSVETTSIFLSDPSHARGVAYVTYTQLGSRTKERAIVTIKKQRHPERFAEIHKGYVCSCMATLEDL